MPVSSVAYVDESVASGLFYTVTGVVVPRSELAAVRRAVVAMLPPGERVHHSVELTEADRAGLSSFLAGATQLQTLVVVRAPINGGDEEGARARAMTELLPRLAYAGAVTIVVDSRTSPQTRDPERANRRDRETLGKLLSAGAVPASMRLQFRRDTDEPMLGLPDMVGWSVRRDLVEGGEARISALGERVRLVEARLMLVRPAANLGNSRGPAILAPQNSPAPPRTGASSEGEKVTAGSGSLPQGWAVTPAPSNGTAAALAVVMARAELVRVAQVHAHALAVGSRLAPNDTGAAATAARVQTKVTVERVAAARRAVEQAVAAAGKGPVPPATRPAPRRPGSTAARYVPPADAGPTRGR